MNSNQPSTHQLREQQFMQHVEQLLSDDRLRLDTKRGRRPVTTLFRDVTMNDRAVELKRLMSQMGKPDRNLEAQMPLGRSVDVALSLRRWWVLKTPVGRLRVICVSPLEALIAGQAPQPMAEGDLTKLLSQIPPNLTGGPSTIVVMSTSGFTTEALASAERSSQRTVILAAPSEAGGWTVSGPPETKSLTDLFDAEAEVQKRQRVRREIEASRVDLLSGGIASEKIAGRSGVPLQLVESELKSYAKENSGLAAKRLDGRVVLFRESSPQAPASGAGGLDMPFIERVKALFSGKGDIEKKIAFLSERRAALSQQRDRGYDDMSVMEGKEAQLREEFKATKGEITRRRLTSHLLQLRKDIDRRQQLLGVLNQQINVVSTHLHNLELQQQGQVANLPNSDEVAADAAAAEEVLAELEASSELADSVAGTVQGGLSAEEQALYEQLTAEAEAQKEGGQTPGQTAPAPPASTGEKAAAPPAGQRAAVTPHKQRPEAEAG